MSRRTFMSTAARRLQGLISVGPAIAHDLELLGVRSVAQLARRNPERLYEGLCRVTGQPQDVCCLDVFRAAVAQARNPLLPIEQCQWRNRGPERKGADAPGLGAARCGSRPWPAD